MLNYLMVVACCPLLIVVCCFSFFFFLCGVLCAVRVLLRFVSLFVVGWLLSVVY